MKKTLMYTLLALCVFSFEVNASCTDEQKAKMIVNNIPQAEIDKICGDLQPMKEQAFTTKDSASKSGLEMRIGFLSGSGTGTMIVDDVTVAEDMETEMSGVKLQFGSLENDTYIYLGLQASEEIEMSGAEAGSTAIVLFGAESTPMNESIGFVFGGEFGVGTQSYADSTGDEYSVVTAEPYIGVRFNISNDFNVNAKIGYRVKLMAAEVDTAFGTSTVNIYDYSVITGLSIGFVTY